MSATNVAANFDNQERLAWAEAALDAAGAKAAASGATVPPDLIAPDGWRWRVLCDLTALAAALDRDYEAARTKQARQAWESRFGGPIATGGGAAVGAVLSALGAGIISTNTVAGWAITVFGVLFAIVGSIFSANTYVQNKAMKLRFLRVLHDLWDYAYMVLPEAEASDAFNQLDTFRQLWESAGS